MKADFIIGVTEANNIFSSVSFYVPEDGGGQSRTGRGFQTGEWIIEEPKLGRLAKVTILAKSVKSALQSHLPHVPG